jgi:FKBP-type peptidyl-prolyl cis-trans isomerase
MRIVSIRTEAEQIRDYITANKVAVTDTIAGGIKIAKTRTRPDSALITAGQAVTVSYTGRLLNGTKFDSSLDKSDTTYAFTVGKSSVVPGWEQGLLKVRRGEKFLLIFPSTFGYGQSGSGQTIPPFSPLAFEINIIRVRQE